MQTLKLYGGPGCGKTHHMLQFFEQELKEHEPEQIAFLTFTRAARQEAASRTGRKAEELPFVRTIHAVCYKQLGLSSVGIVTPEDVVRFGKRVGARLVGTTAADPTEGRFNYHQPSSGDLVLQLGWHLAQHRRLAPDALLRSLPGVKPKFATWLLEAYTRWKESEGLIDYTDLLLKYLELGDPLRCEVLFVDEAQDLSKLQWQVVQKLQQGVERRYLAGDDDQAIFEWAGASPAAFNEEPADEVQVLPQSVRLPRLVHAASQVVIARVRGRYHKNFAPRDDAGEILRNVRLRAEHLATGHTFVLYRNHFRGQALAEQVESFGLPYRGADSPIEPSDVREALQAVVGSSEDDATLTKDQYVALTRYGDPAWVNTSAELLKRPVVEVRSAYHRRPLGPLHQVLSRLPKVSQVERMIQKHGLAAVLNPAITLQTIHTSKGQQADTVVLDYELSRRTFESTYGLGGKTPDEEHRVFYVGMTRARHRLVTLLPDGPFYYQFLRR